MLPVPNIVSHYHIFSQFIINIVQIIQPGMMQIKTIQ